MPTLYSWKPVDRRVTCHVFGCLALGLWEYEKDRPIILCGTHQKRLADLLNQYQRHKLSAETDLESPLWD